MLKIVLSLLILPIIAMATITADQEFALNRMNSVAKKHSLGTLLQRNVNVVVGKYSYAVQGGSSAADINLLTDLTDTHSTISLPSGAIIRRVWFDVVTAPSGASLAFTIQSAGDAKAALAAGSWSGQVEGIPLGTTATMIKLTAARVPKLTLTGTGTAGKVNEYIEYVLGD